MQYLTIPVYISDEFVNPFDLDFSEFGIIIEERDAHKIEEILRSISNLEIIDKQEKIGEIYKEYYTYEGALNNIIKILEK
jgi:hypothetical protein